MAKVGENVRKGDLDYRQVWNQSFKIFLEKNKILGCMCIISI